MIDFSDRLLTWYDEHARQLPWRVPPDQSKSGVRADPYKVWLSEIMLQQTTIAHGIRYFLRFVELWPDVRALSEADRDDIMREWAGLGYYARARNLHACAKQVVELGGFPETAKALQSLPGIGPYTSGAIAAIAFNQSMAAVDGNVERVISRHDAIETPFPDSKPIIREKAQSLVPASRAGDFAQAFMDLGATICTPRSPNCKNCPVSADCTARKIGNPQKYPVKAKKQEKPVRYGRVYLIHDGERLQLERRPEKGLLAGMLGLPTTDWEKLNSAKALPKHPSGETGYKGRVEHVFTHFRLYLDVFEKNDIVSQSEPSAELSRVTQAGLPSVFAKAAQLLGNLI